LSSYIITLYCPYDLQEFTVKVDAVTEELAKKKVIGKTVTCPSGDEFEVEEHYIVSVYPYKPFPAPAYKLMPEERVKEAKWLKGAIVEEPLPLGARPKGSPKLATIVRNGLATLIYEQPVESKAIQFKERYPAFTMKVRGVERRFGPYNPGDIVALPIKKAKELVEAGFAEWAYPYPEYKWKIKYVRHVFTKFFEEARRMSRAGKICEAVYYLIQYSPGITVRMIADILERGYWTVYRCVAELMHPHQLKKLSSEVAEQAKLEKWTADQLGTVKKMIMEQEKKPVKPKVVVGPLWRGQITLYPVKRKTEEELLAELKRILTLEGYPTLTPEEEQELKKQLQQYREEKLKESIMFWLAQEK